MKRFEKKKEICFVIYLWIEVNCHKSKKNIGLGTTLHCAHEVYI